MGSGGDAKRRGITHIEDLSLESSIAVEDLDSLVPAIANIHIPLRIDGDSVDRAEQAVLGPSGSPGLDELAVLVKLRHAGVTVTVGDIDVAGRVPRHVRRPLEYVALLTRTREPSAASATPGCRRSGPTSGGSIGAWASSARTTPKSRRCCCRQPL